MTVTLTGIAIILILLVFLIFGIKTGLIKAVFDLLAFFLTFFLTWVFYPHVAALLIKTPVYEGLRGWLFTTLNGNELLSKSLPEYLYNLPDFIKNSIAVSSKQVYENLVAETVDALTVLTINVISIILLYFTLRLISVFIKKIGTKINKIMIIGPVNMILGGAFGVIRGLFVVYIAMMIISYFPTIKLYEKVALDVDKCYICGYMFGEDAKFLGIPVRYPKIGGM